MKYLLTILLLTGTVYGQTIQTNDTDEFTDSRRIISSFETAEQDAYSGKAQTAVAYLDGEYYLIINSISRDSWQLLGSNTALFLIDGIRSSYAIQSMESEVESGYVLERYLMPLDVDDFLNASQVKFRINGIVFEMSFEAVNSFRIVNDVQK